MSMPTTCRFLVFVGLVLGISSKVASPQQVSSTVENNSTDSRLQSNEVKDQFYFTDELAYSAFVDYEPNEIITQSNHLRGSDDHENTIRMLATDDQWSPIKSQLDGGYCLEPNNRKAKNRNPIVVRPCANVNAQKWQYTGTSSASGVIKSRINVSKCIEASMDETNGKRKIEIRTCDGSSDQKWLVVGNVVYLRSKSSNLVWDWYRSTKSGNPITLMNYNSRYDDQKWTVVGVQSGGGGTNPAPVPAPVAPPVAAPVVVPTNPATPTNGNSNGSKWGPIRSIKDGSYCLEPDKKKAESGNAIVVRLCDNTDSQKWYYTGTNSAAGQIKSFLNSNKCIEASSTSKTDGKRKIEIRSCDGSNDQKWVYNAQAFFLRYKSSNLVFDWLKNGNFGNPITLKSYRSSENDQKWIATVSGSGGNDSGGNSPVASPTKNSGGNSPVAAPSAPTDSGNSWLAGHNSRRAKYHQKYGKSYVPLKWSNSLATDAQNYANKLASTCKFQHDQNSAFGENLHCNWGSNKGYTADQVLTAWTEEEEFLGWSGNGHFTQVLWRSTEYVGCAVATNLNCKYCDHYQVCRYARPGNCGVSGNNWKTPMLKDSTGCTPECPDGGCF
eukprot:CAMPEP_0194376004 /NCGR_PEP_ID=MMETSP0174-20130528/24536_1 /TAXON_ID=216777 /ORGANISM="Proboscia alata, Strain PI-D3" /LENGTH=608 /DNA_ID=CAMNT_0039156535 /DNA_START=84 /DNA_END=1910 /DNA_ORIENTATION=-